MRSILPARMKLPSLLLLAHCCPAFADPPAAPQRPWNEDIIYFALTDRFLDGDPENNIPAGSDPALYDPAQKTITLYHGGDFRGLEKAIASGYFEALGVTAIWISPPVRNVWNSLADLGGPKTGYHGYWAQDFLDIDPHLVSRRSLDDAREYPDSREGRMQHYRDLVALAHAHGLKVIQDIVCNHVGPVFYYDANENGQFDRDNKMEWQLPYRPEGFYAFAKWMSIPEWNALPTMPGGPVTIFGREVKTTGLLQKLETYGRKGMSPDSLGKHDGEEVMCDFFALRDIWTDPRGANFNRLVDEFVEIYRFYLEDIGVDGFRIDTVKHVHREFWEAFCARLRAKVGPERAKHLLLFGEIYDGSAVIAGKYTYPITYPAKKEPVLDSVLNFQLCFGAREYLRHTRGGYGSPAGLENAVKAAMGTAFNPTPGLDGLSARQKLVNFVENHDGLNRFRVAGVGERQNLLADALLLTLEGIPCLYYGTEAALEDPAGGTNREGETGRLTFVPRGHEERFAEARASATFKELAALAQVRRASPTLQRGLTAPLWVDSGGATTDDGLFVFARYVAGTDGKPDPAQTVIVAVNASRQKSVTGLPGNSMHTVAPDGKPLLAGGATLEVLTTAPAGTAGAEASVAEGNAAQLTVPGLTVVIFRVKK
jgi:alpha-amylase